MTARRWPPKMSCLPFEEPDRFAREEGRDAEERAGAALAVEAVAKRHLDRFALAPEPKRAAVTAGLPKHRATRTARRADGKPVSA